jgi:hypothetical protein
MAGSRFSSISGKTPWRSPTVYARAVLKMQALRRELAHALLEVERWKNAVKSRRQAASLTGRGAKLARGARHRSGQRF